GSRPGGQDRPEGLAPPAEPARTDDDQVSFEERHPLEGVELLGTDPERAKRGRGGAFGVVERDTRATEERGEGLARPPGIDQERERRRPFDGAALTHVDLEIESGGTIQGG